MPGACSDGTGPGEALGAPSVPREPTCPSEIRRVYRPTVTAGGEVLVAGCTLGRVERGQDGQPVLVMHDRCRPRSRSRGTDCVSVGLGDLLNVAQQAVEKGP